LAVPLAGLLLLGATVVAPQAALVATSHSHRHLHQGPIIDSQKIFKP
jgi:hypothetical protein